MMEVELKAALGDLAPEAAAERAEAAGFVRRRTVRETDLYFSARDRDFHQTDEALRLRRRRDLPAGTEETLITYKGPKQGGQAKSRLEYETAVGDLTTMERLLTALGYRPLATVEKVRTEYRRGAVTLCLDRVAGLGSFLELERLTEAPGEREAAEEELLALLDALGLPRSALTKTSYLEGLLAKK